MQPQDAYRQSAAQSEQPVHLVVLLYDQLATDLRRAAAALDKHDIERRAKEMDHAFAILGQLQGTLDLERGGEVARQLDTFYNFLRSKLLEAELEDSARLLRRQIESVLSLREAWVEVERSQIMKGVAVEAGLSHLGPAPETPGSWNV